MRKVLLLNLALLGACGNNELVAVEENAGDGQTINEAAVAHIQSQAALLGIGSGDGVHQRLRYVDELGQQHTRFERSFRGLPVRGGDLIVHQGPSGEVLANDEEHGISATLYAPIPFSPTPTLSADQAAAAGANAFVGTRDASVVAPRPQLTVYALDGADNLALAYETITSGTQADGTPSVLHSFVDAHSGRVINSYDEIETVSATGKTLYAGSVTLETTKSGTSYQLVDGLRGGHKTTDSGGTVYSSTSTTFGDGTSKSAASAAADAHYGAAVTWDYYKNVHGRSGIANDGKGATSVVHYGTNYNNAFWSDSCFCMTYGDGDGKLLKTLVALDVAGHEMSHGVTARTANLTYSGESGGLNEATSDIFGTSVEFYAKNTAEPGNYLIGEVVAGPSLGTKFLRSMISPTDDGASVDNYSLYKSSLDVHLSSGIANNFFYLLSEGGKNKTSGKSVTGITRAKAEKIWFRALTSYFTSATTFKKAKAATLKAAGDLYGTTSAEATAVTNAWTAVGVN